MERISESHVKKNVDLGKGEVVETRALHLGGKYRNLDVACDVCGF